MFDTFTFNSSGRTQCMKLATYFTQMFSLTPATVDCKFIFNDFVVEITENGTIVNKYIAYPDMNGKIGILRISGMNLSLIYNRYLNDHKVLWFDAADCERDPWGEYLEFKLA